MFVRSCFCKKASFVCWLAMTLVFFRSHFTAQVAGFCREKISGCNLLDDASIVQPENVWKHQWNSCRNLPRLFFDIESRHDILVLRKKPNWAVVSNSFYVHPYLGKIPILTDIFQMGWNHQPANMWSLIWGYSAGLMVEDLLTFVLGSSEFFYPNDPWEWYIYLQFTIQINQTCIGKCTIFP